MYISLLVLDDFRSWQHCRIELEPGVNILQGANGLGKTNIVEAVEVLSTGTSHRVSNTMPLIRSGAESATIRANVTANTAAVTTYEATLHARGANRARIDGGNSLYLRDITGRIPSISFTPEDQQLISGDPAMRRAFFDKAGILLEPDYNATLQRYTHVARQRVALLKRLAESDGAGNSDAMNELEIWTGQLIETGMKLTRTRADIVRRMAEPFMVIYRELCGKTDDVELKYEPSFAQALSAAAPAREISQHFQRIYPGEVARGQNLIGPHRDEYPLILDGMPAREFASNGEMWTMALALKMAVFQLATELRGVKPIVILDDVFAQLDETRRRQILDFALRQDQVLITVAAASDIPEADSARHIDVTHLLEVEADDNSLLVARLFERQNRSKDDEGGGS